MFYWTSKSAILVEKGVEFFFVQNQQKGGVFKLGYEHGIRFHREWRGEGREVALSLASRLATASERSSNTGPSFLIAPSHCYPEVLNQCCPVLQLNGSLVARCDLEKGWRPRYYQILVRLATQEFLLSRSMSDRPRWCRYVGRVVIKIYIFFKMFLCRTTQNLCGPPSVPSGWSAGWHRIFR